VFLKVFCTVLATDRRLKIYKNKIEDRRQKELTQKIEDRRTK